MKKIFDENQQRIAEQEEKLQTLRIEREALIHLLEKYDHDIETKEKWIARCTIENKFIARNNLF